MDEEVERLLLLAEKEENQHPAPIIRETHPPLYNGQPHFSTYLQRVPLASANNHFTSLKSDEEVEEARKLATPKNTEKNTAWAVKVWKDWALSRQKSCPGQQSEWPVHLYLATPELLNYWLSKFVLEARTKNGDYHPPNTLYSICCGLLRYVREIKPALNFFKDSVFKGFQNIIDSEMKRLTSL